MADTRTTEDLVEAIDLGFDYDHASLWKAQSALDTLTARLTAYEAEGTPELFALLRAEHGAGRCSFETYTRAHIAVEKYLHNAERVRQG